MASAAEALAFLRQNYKIIQENDNIISLGWNFDDGRSQIVLVEIRDNLLRVVSAFAKVAQVSAAKVLEENDSIFGIAQIGEYFYLTHTILLENADANEIADPIGLVPIHADEFEKKLGLGDAL